MDTYLRWMTFIIYELNKSQYSYLKIWSNAVKCLKENLNMEIQLMHN